MACTLDEFCAEASGLLKSEPLPGALEAIARRLRNLLSNPQFVAQTFDDDMPPGRRVLHHDAETDFYVLAHVQEGNKTGKPHSHGSSWAIYGNARASTEMTECAPLSPRSGRHTGLWTWGDSLDGTSGEGVGHPGHRNGPRPLAAIPLRKEGQDPRTRVSLRYFRSAPSAL